MRLFRSTREWLQPVLTSSAFLERGVLTPEEFVRAGDQLVACCPTWQWYEGETAKNRPYLPKEKQFLMTRGVPSYCRVAHMNSTAVVDGIVEGGLEGDRDWEAPTLQPMADYDSDEEVLVDATDSLDLSPKEPIEGQKQITNAVAAQDDEYADMEDESLALDEATQIESIAGSKPSSSSSSKTSGVLRSRRYDVTMTYDKYYQTPRIWLFGYNENGSPLPPEAVFQVMSLCIMTIQLKNPTQDVMQDYAKKTVTIDPHPHISRPFASIHPCQHANAMKKILDTLSECGKVPDVDQYLFIFLKFIQSVVPTIEYDYTMDVRAGK